MQIFFSKYFLCKYFLCKDISKYFLCLFPFLHFWSPDQIFSLQSGFDAKFQLDCIQRNFLNDCLVFLILSYSASNLALMQNHSADLQLVCNFFNKVLIFFILLVFSLQSGFDAESFCRFTTCVHSVQLLELWKKQARHLARRMCKTHCASRACLNFPFNSLLACIYTKLNKTCILVLFRFDWVIMLIGGSVSEQKN